MTTNKKKKKHASKKSAGASAANAAAPPRRSPGDAGEGAGAGADGGRAPDAGREALLETAMKAFMALNTSEQLYQQSLRRLEAEEMSPIEFEVDYPDGPDRDDDGRRGLRMVEVPRGGRNVPRAPDVGERPTHEGVTVLGERHVPLDSARFKAAMRHMRHKEANVIEASTVTLVITYPLSKEHRETLSSETGAFSREQLCILIALAYENIYEEERRTSTLPEETMNERGGLPLANRAPTNGTYGIWGHVLPDLLLHTVYYLPAKNEIHLGIDT